MSSKHPFQDIIDRWPTQAVMAEDAGVKPIAVYRWYERKSIPAKHDAALIDAASRRNIPLNWRELMDARARQGDQGGARDRGRDAADQRGAA